ncbi:unnamed protein product [Linum trigynum]|uniref:Uncharacterized protein n=1 Tax=Linum trigynum TaxID=586398 RepID=A0AAV2G7V9_9ROSI
MSASPINCRSLRLDRFAGCGDWGLPKLQRRRRPKLRHLQRGLRGGWGFKTTIGYRESLKGARCAQGGILRHALPQLIWAEQSDGGAAAEEGDGRGTAAAEELGEGEGGKEERGHL